MTTAIALVDTFDFLGKTREEVSSLIEKHKLPYRSEGDPGDEVLEVTTCDGVGRLVFASGPDSKEQIVQVSCWAPKAPS